MNLPFSSLSIKMLVLIASMVVKMKRWRTCGCPSDELLSSQSHLNILRVMLPKLKITLYARVGLLLTLCVFIITTNLLIANTRAKSSSSSSGKYFSFRHFNNRTLLSQENIEEINKNLTFSSFHPSCITSALDEHQWRPWVKFQWHGRNKWITAGRWRKFILHEYPKFHAAWAAEEKWSTCHTRGALMLLFLDVGHHMRWIFYRLNSYLLSKYKQV